MSSDYIDNYIKVDKYENKNRISKDEEFFEVSSLCIGLKKFYY